MAPKKYDYGVKTWHRPAKPTVDICFIHGLTGHRDKTWSADGSWNEPWPRTLLPAKFPHARLLTFGYDAAVVRASVASNDSIRTLANNLLRSLVNDRRDDSALHRPLVFIAHSLGGIVCKKAVSQSQHSADDKLASLAASLIGLIFMGTPHDGSSFANAAALLMPTLGLFKSTNKNLLKVLKKDNEVAADIDDEFWEAWKVIGKTSKEHINIFCFYEILSVPVVKSRVVPEASAVYPQHPSQKIDADHHNMVKFRSAEDPGFKNLCSVLRDFFESRRAGLLFSQSEEPQCTPKEGSCHPPGACRDDGKHIADGTATRRHDEPSNVFADNSRQKSLGPYETVFTLQSIPASANFVDRPSDTAAIEKSLLYQSDSKETRRRTFILHGLGGIGKTQLAANFARRQQAVFSSVFWLDGRSEDRLRQSLAACASRIQEGEIPDRSRKTVHTGEELDTAVADVLDWFARPGNKRWLLVFDNVDQDPVRDRDRNTGAYDVRKYLPGDHGSVLITTRLAQMAQMGDSKRLTKVDTELGRAIFQNWRGAQRSLEDADESSEELLSLLDGLPLALAQAASYLRETGLDTTSYLRLYKGQWDELMQPKDESDLPLMEYDGSVATTWAISFKAIEAQNEGAANLLRLWAFFDNKDLWHGLLQAATKDVVPWPRWLEEMARSEVRFLEATRLLARYSLIEAQKAVPGAYDMHPVVHKWASHIQDDVGKPKFQMLAVMVVGLAVPVETQKGYWMLQCRLLPHAEKCCLWTEAIHTRKGDILSIILINAINRLATLYSFQEKPREAEKMYRWVLKECEMTLGCDDEWTLMTVSSLGALYQKKGMLEEAEAMFQGAVRGFENTLGPDHRATFDAIDNLGALYRHQGRLTEAETILRRALEGRERLLGSDHTSTLLTVNNLGFLFRDQNKLKEAEAMFQRALKGLERAYGPDNTMTLSVANNLGVLYTDQGMLEEAEAMFQWALKGREATLGHNHALTLNTANSLGVVYYNQRKLGEAEAMLQWALIGREKTLGPDHKSTLDTADNLGHVYKKRAS